MRQDSQPPTPLRIRPKAAGRPVKAERPVSCWRTWPKAGRIWFDQEGHPHYQIRRTIKGKAYQVSLPAGLTEVAAGVMLGRFLDDPDGFDPRGEARPDPIYLDAKLVKEFLTWAKLYGGKDGKGTSAAWRGIQRQHLMFWMEKLHGLDLRAGTGPRSVDLGQHIMPALSRKDGSRVPSYRQRIAVIKTLYSWLRTQVHRLKPAEDPVFGRLKVPASKSAQGEGDSKVIPVKDVLAVVDWLKVQDTRPDALTKILSAVRAHAAGAGHRNFHVKTVAKAAGVSTSHVYYYFKDKQDLVTAAKTGVYAGKGAWRPGATRWPDMLLFLLATAWHVTELHRFMVDGEIEAVPEEGVQDPERAGVAVVVCKRAKRSNKLKTRISSVGLEVAKRLLRSGGFSVSVFYKEIARACAGAKLPAFRPGNMRHTVSTYAQNHGAQDPAIEAFLNHAANAAVLLRYYSRGVALRVPTPI